MSSESRRPSKLLELLLVQPASSEMPAKRKIQQAVESHFDASLKKKRREFLRSAVEAVSSDKYLCNLLNFAECEHGEAKEPLVIVTKKKVDYCEASRHVSRLKLVLTGDERYYIQDQVYWNILEEGKAESAEDFKELCEKLVHPNIKFCPGLPVEEYEKYREVIKCERKGVKVVDRPLKRISAKNCLMWYHIPRGVSKERKQMPEVLCRECVRLRCYLQADVKRQISRAKKLSADSQVNS